MFPYKLKYNVPTIITVCMQNITHIFLNNHGRI